MKRRSVRAHNEERSESQRRDEGGDDPTKKVRQRISGGWGSGCLFAFSLLTLVAVQINFAHKAESGDGGHRGLGSTSSTTKTGRLGIQSKSFSVNAAPKSSGRVVEGFLSGKSSEVKVLDVRLRGGGGRKEKAGIAKEDTPVFIGIKTTPKNQDRASSILETYWRFAPHSTVFFTDTNSTQSAPWATQKMDDPPLAEPTKDAFNHIDTGCGGSHEKEDLCCKTSAEIKYYATHAMDETPWFCQVDDDTFVNVPQLVEYLQQFDADAKPGVYVGYGRAKGVKDANGINRRVWFGTGGAGWCLSRALVRRGLADFLALTSTCLSIRYSDDVTVGYVVQERLGVNFTCERRFHSHYDDQKFASLAEARGQITFGSGLQQSMMQEMTGRKKKGERKGGIIVPKLVKTHSFVSYPGSSFVDAKTGQLPKTDPLGFRGLFCDFWPGQCVG